MRQKNILFFILVAILCALAIAGWLIVFKQKSSAERLAQLPVTQELLECFIKVDPALDAHTQTPSSASVWWNDAGYNIIIPSIESILVAVTNERAPLDGNVPDAYFSEELKIVRDVFSRRGFVPNKKNSSASTKDTRFYDYVQAYEKDDELCTVTVNPDLSSYEGGGAKIGYTLIVSCGNTLTEAKARQRPLLDALGLRDKEAVVRIVKQHGAFFEVSMGYRRTGQAAVLKQEGDRYRVLLISQESPPCEIIDKEKIPSDVLSSIGQGGCYTDTGAYREPSL